MSFLFPAFPARSPPPHLVGGPYSPGSLYLLDRVKRHLCASLLNECSTVCLINVPPFNIRHKFKQNNIGCVFRFSIVLRFNIRYEIKQTNIRCFGNKKGEMLSRIVLAQQVLMVSGAETPAPALFPTRKCEIFVVLARQCSLFNIWPGIKPTLGPDFDSINVHSDVLGSI